MNPIRAIVLAVTIRQLRDERDLAERRLAITTVALKRVVYMLEGGDWLGAQSEAEWALEQSGHWESAMEGS